jgi:predicted membrane chloride channel (bestrophin family)
MRYRPDAYFATTLRLTGSAIPIAFPRVLCLMPISIGAAIVHHYGFDIMPGEGAVYAPSFELVCAVPSV